MLARPMVDSAIPRPMVDWEQEHLTFRSIWRAADVQRGAEALDRARRFSSRMAALVLAHAAYEGFINECIRRLRPDVWRQERTFFRGRDLEGTMGRTRFLAKELGVEIARTAPPYRTVAELCAWRNDLVHPQSVRVSGTTSAHRYATQQIDAPPVVFAKLTSAFAKRCFEDAVALSDALLQSPGARRRPELRALGKRALWGPSNSRQGSLKA